MEIEKSEAKFAQALQSLYNSSGETQFTIQSLDLQEAIRQTETISVDDLKKLSKFYGVSTDYLLGLSPSSNAEINPQSVGAYLGLSEKAVKDIPKLGWSWILEMLLDENEQFEHLLALLEDLRFNAERLEESIAEWLEESDPPEESAEDILAPIKELENRYNTVCTILYEIEESFHVLLDKIIPTEKSRAKARELI